MKKSLNELHDFIHIDWENSEWARDLDFKGRLKEFFNEVEELKKALDKDDKENLAEELGDCLWDLMYAIVLGDKEKIFSSKKVVTDVTEKIKKRKPWILKGEQTDRAEELRIWKEVKKLEKEKKLR
ncbi:MAG: hypothetical protein KKF89_02795 [Nanoarchaeota archaeon]|nr:hypothetical protein [Nanoarchaeota archaeon]MBU1854621.1 hypothetical protein [Nanoarchaeota archaeon]